MLRIIFNTLFFVLSVVTLYSVYQSTKFPRKFKIESSVDITGDVKDIYPLIGTGINWEKWQPWRDADPKFVMYFEGPPYGPGAQMQWISKRRGTGQFTWGSQKVWTEKELEDVRDEPVTLEWAMYVKDFGGKWICEFIIQRDALDDGLIHVTWRLSGSRVPLERPFWFIFSLDEVIRRDLQSGLLKLKRVVESGT